MKICFILEHAYPKHGGVETAFHELGMGLVKRGHTVHILTSESGGISGNQIVNGVFYHHFPWRHFFNHALPSKKDIELFIKDSNIVHTTTYTAASLSRSLAEKYHKLCIITVLEVLKNKWFWVENNPLKAMLFLLFEQYVIHQNYSLYHAVSYATKKDMISSKISEKKIKMIYHGINEEYRLYGDSKNISTGFLYYGRPGKTKGVFILLESIRLLNGILPKKYTFHFILSKDPQGERMKFEKMVKKYDLRERIQISNSLERKDLIKAISEACCVIIPSITEGFGFSAAETSALHKPLIISDAGSLPEVAYGKVLMFKNRDSNDLAQKIQSAVKGKFIIVPEKKFDWNTTVTQMENLYKKLVKKQ